MFLYIVNHLLCAFFVFYTLMPPPPTHTQIHVSSSFTRSSLLLPMKSFILKLLKSLVSRRIAQWTLLLVNMSNASVEATETIHGYSAMTVTYATPVLSLLKAQRVWGRDGVENCVLYAWVSVLVGRVAMPEWGTEEVLASQCGNLQSGEN